MTPIRALRPDDLGAVAALYEAVARSGARTPAPGLVEQFERTLFGNPHADPELPSLVYEDPKAGIVGFLGSHPRRMRCGDRALRMACSGQLVADPTAGRPGVGALLLRKYMAGPQDLTITDGATDTVRTMWEALGGDTSALASLGWTRVLRPGAFARAMLERRGRTLPRTVARVVDAAAGRRLAPEVSTAVTEPLTAACLADAAESLAREFELRPAYDEGYVGWLLAEAEAVRARGPLERRLVSLDGAIAGWYVAYMPSGGVAQALQVGCARRGAGPVLDRLFADAAAAGCAGVQGRLEPALLAAIRERRCLVRRSEWALVAANDTQLLSDIAYGRALLTRLDGEWWMGHHL